MAECTSTVACSDRSTRRSTSVASCASIARRSSTSTSCDELRQDAHGDYIVLLSDRTEVRVGRRFRARLQAWLGQSL